MAMDADDAGPLPDKPKFAPLAPGDKGAGGEAKVEFRRVPVPQHRMTPLKTAWMELYKPITENLKLDMRMNLKTKKVCSRNHVPGGGKGRERLESRRQRQWCYACRWSSSPRRRRRPRTRCRRQPTLCTHTC